MQLITVSPSDFPLKKRPLSEMTVITLDEKSKEVIRNLTREISPCDGLFIRPDVDRELRCVVSGPSDDEIERLDLSTVDCREHNFLGVFQVRSTAGLKTLIQRNTQTIPFCIHLEHNSRRAVFVILRNVHRDKLLYAVRGTTRILDGGIRC